MNGVWGIQDERSRGDRDERGRKVTHQPFTLSLGFDAALRGGGEALTIDAKAVYSRSR